MSEELNDRRLGERRVDPCIHERDWIRLEQTVERHDKELRDLHADGTGTKIYMKQVLESQDEIKASIRSIQEELRSRPSPPPAPTPVELVQSPAQLARSETQTVVSILKSVLPDLIKILGWAILIIGTLVGASGLLTKAMGGS